MSYALKGFSGARLSSPRVRWVSIYASSRVDSLALNTQLKPVDSGGNVLILKPYDEGVFNGSQVRYDLRAVSPVQLYLDVKSMAGRGEEAAEEILVRELRPSWQ
ncbi:MAG: type IV toxin-antitoxin system AbiEi family antitoxin [Actinomycetia bacterium]|nr:type IV toxin-antitoxin system AbiEi family antitoxin [Actinomycetes bacterium]